MKSRTELTQYQAIIVAGSGLFLMTLLAIFANFFVLEKLIVSGEAALTATNIMASETLFRVGICCLIIVAILDILVAWALYILLKPIHKNLSLLAAIFRLVYATILGAVLANLLIVLNLLNDTYYSQAFTETQLYSQVMLSINKFDTGWNIGIIFFGFHLLILGYLVYKSEFIHKIIGILLIIAGMGYVIDAFGLFLIPNYNISIGMFTFIGELIFMFWLLFRSGADLNMFKADL